MAVQIKRQTKKPALGHTEPNGSRPKAPASLPLTVQVKETILAPAKSAEEAPPAREIPVPQRERSAYDGDTAIKLYLREIGLVKLLTPAEEIELAAKIKKGDKKAREQMIKAGRQNRA